MSESYHVVPKNHDKANKNDNGEEMSARVALSWRVCLDYKKLNLVTRKDHHP